MGILLLFASSTGTLVVPTIAAAEDRPSTAKENRAKAQALVKKGNDLFQAKTLVEALVAHQLRRCSRRRGAGHPTQSLQRQCL